MIKALMVCLGREPKVAGWKTQTNPLSYGGTPVVCTSCSLKVGSNKTANGHQLYSVII